ncbi:MAG: hypothetical protein JO117_06900 [Verrucomicrobia bacterium]|nr:hypothetical protein [Verrucomicrobiota bacterium]MBV9656815.1 hypothetical protein [Verrucomicrobiota bacterium]
MLALDRLRAADFTPLLHRAFRLPMGELSLSLELLEVRENKRPAQTPEQRAPFSLTFKAAPAQPVLAPRMYRLEEETLGALDLFISPFRADADGCYYEAVFN